MIKRKFKTINQLIEEALAEINDLILGHRIVLEKHLLPAELYLSIDNKQIKKALVNILNNAIESMETYPKILKLNQLNPIAARMIAIITCSNGNKMEKTKDKKSDTAEI